MRSKLLIGTALRPRGLKGEIKAEIYSSKDDFLAGYKGVVQIDGKEYRVQKYTQAGAFGYFQLAGVDSVEGAEALRGKEIYADRKDLPPTLEGEHFIVDIIGLDVFVDDRAIGKICDVLQYGAADVYQVTTLDGGSLSFPALKALIKTVDLDRGVMVLDKKIFDSVVVYNDEK